MANPPPTQVFRVMPWDGGVNTSKDPSHINPKELTVGDNIVFDQNDSKKQRDGINHNWDNAAPGSASVLAEVDYWSGNLPKTQLLVSVLSDGTMYKYNLGTGVRTALTVSGQAWTGPLSSASLLVFGNKVFIAVSGTGNVMKYWDGTNPVQDVFASYGLTSISRSSAGTTRTIVFNKGFPALAGSTVIIAGSANANYNGTFTVASLATTTVANDTITYVAAGALTEASTPDTAISAGQPGPLGSMLREHLGRIFCNDKTNPDRLHYCATFDYTTWLGWGDSGAVDCGVGDGDPVGINGISPAFKGVIFIGKKSKLYRMDGQVPEEFFFNKISDGIGVVSHNSWASVDEEDLFFVSERGVHSISTTANYGDFEATFVSEPIQKTFFNFNRARLSNCWAVYVSTLNSVAFTFASLSSQYNDQLWFYNVVKKTWYRWSGMACESIAVVNDADKRRLYIGTNTGRISRTFNGSTYDVSSSGAQVAVPFHLTTGNIYPSAPVHLAHGDVFPDGDPYMMKLFKRFILFYKPSGTYTISVNITIDNHPINPENSLSFSEVNSSALVGSTFITGSSVVGSEVVLGPYARSIDGYGRGCKIDITQSSVNGQVEIQGYAIEWEPAGYSYEVFLR